MAKCINVEISKKKYCLEYNRASIVKLEKEGFKIQDLEEKPITNIPKLFHGAFFKNHPEVTFDEAIDIYEQLKDKQSLLTALTELYSIPILSLLGSEEKEEGNLGWELV